MESLEVGGNERLLYLAQSDGDVGKHDGVGDDDGRYVAVALALQLVLDGPLCPEGDVDGRASSVLDPRLDVVEPGLLVSQRRLELHLVVVVVDDERDYQRVSIRDLRKIEYTMNTW